MFGFFRIRNFHTISEETSTSWCCEEAFHTRNIHNYLRESGIDVINGLGYQDIFVRVSGVDSNLDNHWTTGFSAYTECGRVKMIMWPTPLPYITWFSDVIFQNNYNMLHVYAVCIFFLLKSTFRNVHYVQNSQYDVLLFKLQLCYYVHLVFYKSHSLALKIDTDKLLY